MVQASGTRQKKWMENPDTGEQVLVKWPNYGSGEVYTEKICSELGRLCNIPIMRVDIGCCGEVPVILAYNFLLPGEELIEGGDFFEDYQADSGKPSLPPEYTFQRIRTIVEPYGLLPDLLNMMVFDALVANSDRHQDNWGLCFKETQVRFAPLYDHGSSLDWNSNEDKVRKRMLDNRMYWGFINQGKSMIQLEAGHKINHCNLMTGIAAQTSVELRNSIRKISALNEGSISSIIQGIPSVIMSDIRKEFVIRLLLDRKACIERLVS
ncbi:HipA domain-containing protein [Syntrophomonas palmitatica]|uniref:HipA domain-containing protein n=1 Tax=Syntrophomonas palmitatica TaxID=402877 RepID=UPI0006D244D1|nr:HipA domain-containing protein [Syntrophomonas palmitatica]